MSARACAARERIAEFLQLSFSLALVGEPALDPCVRDRSINDGAEIVHGVADRVCAELLGNAALGST